MKFEVNFGKIKAIAKKEFMDNVRSRWILALTILFLILTLVVSYFSITMQPTVFSQMSPAGTWDPANNIPVLGDMGEGGQLGSFYQISTPGNTSIDGNNTWMPGDWIYHDGDSWVRVKFRGMWDAANNTPVLSDEGGNGTFADYFIVSVDGNTTIDGVSSWEESNIIIHDGKKWKKIGDIEVETIVKFDGYKDTVDGISTLTSMLLPIIAIMVGYGTIISERENGSMGVVLGCPVSRADVIIGKYLGLGLVTFFTIFAGFGLAGIVVGAFAGTDMWLEYILFMFCTFIFTLFFLGFAIFFSVIAKKRSTAIGGGLFLWFSGMIAGMVVFGLWAATGADMGSLVSTTLTGGEMPVFPDWVWAGEFFNFMDLYAFGSMKLFGITEFFGFTVTTPGFVNATSVFGWFASLSFVSFVLSIFGFRRKDI